METVSHRVSRTRRVDAWADSSPHWNGRTLGVEFRIVGVEQDAGKDDDEVSGSINWDGCCNWSTTEGYAAHFCDWQEALEVAECFKVAHALAGVIMAAERLQEANWPDVGAEWTEESDNG